MQNRTAIRTEIRAMSSLALPVVIAQLSQMGMGFIDVVMVGRLGSEHLAGVAIGGALYFFFMVFCFGIISAVSPMVAHAYGAGDSVEIGTAVGQGLWLATALAAMGILIAWNTESILLLFGQDPIVVGYASDYVTAMSFGLGANLWFTVFRAFADGIGRTRVAMVIAGVCVFINAGADYVLIYGKLGFPALGVAGAGYATAIVRWSMLIMMLWYVFRTNEFISYKFLHRARKLNREYIAKMLRLGVPIGAGHSMENGFFGVTSLLMGYISTVALASHQVAINVAALAFMVPMGISFATTTRVGQAMGRKEPGAATLAGWVGIGLSGFVMCCTAVLFILFAPNIVRIYTDQADVISYASGLLLIAGIFQVSDGLQVGAMGALRGLKDTTRPMVTNLFAYWLIGLPCGYLLGFTFGYGGQGLWWGLTIGLTVAAILHCLRFRKLVRQSVA